MRQLRDLLNDLVERRLWPVALLLVAALVAVPLVLAKPAPNASPVLNTDAPAPTAPSPAAPADATPAVSLAQAAPDGAPLAGRAKDPFRQQHVPPKPSVGGVTPATASSGGGVGTPSDGTTPPPSGGGQPPTTFVRATIDVRFGKTGGTAHNFKDLARLAPLPNAIHPIAIFLGMRTDHKTAVFLISSDVHAKGDGRCVPSRKDCEAIELTEGDVEFLDVAQADGRVVEFELDLVKVGVTALGSQAAAQAAFARVSSAGAKLLRRRAATSELGGGEMLAPYRWAPQDGVLHIALRAWRRQQRLLASRAVAQAAPGAPSAAGSPAATVPAPAPAP